MQVAFETSELVNKTMDSYPLMITRPSLLKVLGALLGLFLWNPT